MHRNTDPGISPADVPSRDGRKIYAGSADIGNIYSDRIVICCPDYYPFIASLVLKGNVDPGGI